MPNGKRDEPSEILLELKGSRVQEFKSTKYIIQNK